MILHHVAWYFKEIEVGAFWGMQADVICRRELLAPPTRMGSMNLDQLQPQRVSMQGRPVCGDLWRLSAYLRALLTDVRGRDDSGRERLG